MSLPTFTSAASVLEHDGETIRSRIELVHARRQRYRVVVWAERQGLWADEVVDAAHAVAVERATVLELVRRWDARAAASTNVVALSPRSSRR